MCVSQLELQARAKRRVNYAFEKYLNKTLTFITAGRARSERADLAGDVISTALRRLERAAVLFGFCARSGVLQVTLNNVRVRGLRIREPDLHRCFFFGCGIPRMCQSKETDVHSLGLQSTPNTGHKIFLRL